MISVSGWISAFHTLLYPLCKQQIENSLTLAVTGDNKGHIHVVVREYKEPITVSVCVVVNNITESSMPPQSALCGSPLGKRLHHVHLLQPIPVYSHLLCPDAVTFGPDHQSATDRCQE